MILRKEDATTLSSIPDASFDWVVLDLWIAGERFDPRTVALLSYRQVLDLRRGLLLRTVHFQDRQGRRSLLKERRLVSMADMHLGALEL